MISSTLFKFALALLLTHVALALPHAESSTRSITARATFDTTFDNAAGSLNGVACSNGANGLAANFPTFGDLPTFPYIGGAPGIAWNSPNCGGCWKLTNAATGAWIIMTAVDSAATFNIAQGAFEALNGGQIGQGTLNVVADQVPRSFCGLY
jgi:Cerato-platanin